MWWIWGTFTCYLRSRERAQGDKEPCAWNCQKRLVAHSQMNTARFCCCCARGRSRAQKTPKRCGLALFRQSKNANCESKVKRRIFTYRSVDKSHKTESLSVFLFTCTWALPGFFSVPGFSSEQNPNLQAGDCFDFGGWVLLARFSFFL